MMLTIRTMLSLSLLVVSAVNALGYMVIGPTAFYDATTMWITLAFCAFLLVAVIKGDDALLPMFALLAIFLLLFVFTRETSYLYLPERISFPLFVELSIQEINSAYVYIVIGTVALFMGFFLAHQLFKGIAKEDRAAPQPVKIYPTTHLGIVLIAVCVGQLYITLWLGNSVLQDVHYGVEHPLTGIFSVLLSSHQALAIAMVSLLASRKGGEVSYWKIFLFTIIYMLTTVMLGSRSGGIWIIETVLVAMLVLRGNFSEHLRIYLGFMILVIAMSVIFFPVATAVRTALIAERDAKEPTSITPSRTLDSEPPLVELEKIERRAALSGGALSRLGAPFDTVAMTMALEPDHEMLARTINLSYALKSAVNVITPGVIFDDAQTNTALLWPFIYKLRESRLLQKGYYESFIWTAWGVTYGMFGWGGGIAAMLFSGFVLQATYMAISRWRGGGRPYFLAWFLLYTFQFYSAMGLDDSLVYLQRSLFATFTIFIMLWGLSRLTLKRDGPTP